MLYGYFATGKWGQSDGRGDGDWLELAVWSPLVQEIRPGLASPALVMGEIGLRMRRKCFVLFLVKGAISDGRMTVNQRGRSQLKRRGRSVRISTPGSQ